MKFITTTPNGVNGHGISFTDELACAESLKDILPNWQVRFSWSQILFSDVQYNINKKDKCIDITYNQNLRHWWSPLRKEVLAKLVKMKVF